MAFALAAALAGLSGALYAHHLHVINPMLFSLHYLLLMFVMMFVGGKGTLGGPVLGAAIFTFVPEWLPTTDEVDLVILGAILLIAILFMPRGVYPALVSGWDRLTRMSSSTKKAEIADK